MADLGNLMQRAAQLSPEPSKPALPYGIHPNDDDLTCVWKVMSDSKGRTATELMAALAEHIDQVDPDDIPGLLQLLVTNGFALRQANRNDEHIYHLKKGITMSMINDKSNTPTKLRGAQSALQGISLDGKIDLSEGIAVCVWKVMADRKARKTDQILDILGAYGVNREVAKDTVIKAKVAWKWFDTHGSGQGMTLKMKKHIKMPPIENVDPDTLKQKMTPGAVRVISAPNSKLPSFPVSASTPVFVEKGRRHVETQSKMQFEELEPASAIMDTRTDTTLPIPHHVITKNDTLDVAIWKVMSDLKWYSSTDIGLLLEEFDHQPASTRSRISRIHLHGPHWFTRERRPSVAGGHEYIYRLKADVCLPGTDILPGQPAPQPEATATPAPTDTTIPEEKEDSMQKSAAASQGAATSLGEVLKEAIDKNPEALAPVPSYAPPAAPRENAAPPLVHAQPPAAPMAPYTPPAPPVENAAASEQFFKIADLPDTDLLKFQVLIRNTPFSFKQVDQLARDLVAQGFGQGKKRATPQSILQATYRVGNSQFSSDELENLTIQLHESGFGADDVDSAQ